MSVHTPFNLYYWDKMLQEQILVILCLGNKCYDNKFTLYLISWVDICLEMVLMTREFEANIMI